MEHGERFTLQKLQMLLLHAVKLALCFQNIRNSISPTHAWYDQAVEWGEQWLRNN